MSEEVNVPQEGEAPEAGQGLSYGDITAAVQIIDVVCGRGAIQGDELIQVGTIRERFVAFLNFAKSQGEEVGDVPPSSLSGVNEEESSEEEAPAEAAE